MGSFVSNCTGLTVQTVGGNTRTIITVFTQRKYNNHVIEKMNTLMFLVPRRGVSQLQYL